MKEKLVVATGGCQVYGWRFGSHSGVVCHVWESAAQHSGSCNNTIESTSCKGNKKTYITNPDEGVGVWAVRRDVGGGVYRAHASKWGLVGKCSCERRLEALRRGRVSCSPMTLWPHHCKAERRATWVQWARCPS